MSCEGYIHISGSGGGKCKYGFPVTTGCWASGTLAKNMAPGVKCLDEEWCGKVYEKWGGKPPIQNTSNQEIE